MPDPDRVTSNVLSFTTPSRVISVSTGTSSDVTDEEVTVSGTLDELAGYDSSDCSFQYREAGASTWSETTPQARAATGEYTDTISGLASETEYEWRARATTEHDGQTVEDTGTTQTFTTDPPHWQTYTAGTGTGEESTIYVYDSEEPGPVTMGINIHASERTAINALEDIESNWEYPIETGTLLVWPAPCPSAYTNETQTCNGTDLNTAFDLTNGPQTTVAQTIEDELINWNVDHLVDLHTRSTLYENGGEAHAIFPSDDGTTRPISQAAVDNINNEYSGYAADEAWQVGNTVDANGAENDGMLVTYAWEEHSINGQIGITWSAIPDADQIDQHQRILAETLNQLGYTLGPDASTLVS